MMVPSSSIKDREQAPESDDDSSSADGSAGQAEGVGDLFGSRVNESHITETKDTMRTRSHFVEAALDSAR